MSRKLLRSALVSGCVFTAFILAPAVQADVKTTQKSQMKFEGMLGRMAGMAGGASGKDGATNSVAVKGNRMATFTDQTGTIVDLSEQKIYQVDLKKKEYKVMTFAEMKAMMDKARADMEKAMKDMPPEMRSDAGQPTTNLEVTFDVKPGSEPKTIAGHQAKHVIVTVTAKEKGKTIDEGGGMVITNEVWLGPRIAALNEIGTFSMKYATAIYGDSMAAMGQQVASLSAMYPGLTNAMKVMGEQLQKLEGTPLMTIQRTETVKSAAAMSQAQAPPSGGGGIGGMLGRKMMGNKGKPEQRSLLYTSTTETVSIETAATDADVAIPAGFKEKK
jgi:hypothetical protein